MAHLDIGLAECSQPIAGPGQLVCADIGEHCVCTFKGLTGWLDFNGEVMRVAIDVKGADEFAVVALDRAASSRHLWKSQSAQVSISFAVRFNIENRPAANMKVERAE